MRFSKSARCSPIKRLGWYTRSISQLIQYFSTKYFFNIKHYPYTVGIGSFLEETDNHVSILQLSTEKSSFEPILTFPHKYPPTKLMWIPDIRGSYDNIMATSGESLKIYMINDEKKVELKSDLRNVNYLKIKIKNLINFNSKMNFLHHLHPSIGIMSQKI